MTHYDDMTDEEALTAIGHLITRARSDKYGSRRQFVLATGLDNKTVVRAETGQTEQNARVQRTIERHLGWRKGAIDDVWRHRDELHAEELTLEEMERGAAQPSWEDLENNHTPVTRASQLTDEEVAVEALFRLRNLKAEVERLKKEVARLETGNNAPA